MERMRLRRMRRMRWMKSSEDTAPGTSKKNAATAHTYTTRQMIFPYEPKILPIQP